MFGAELKRSRLAAGLSQTELGDLAGLDGSYITHLEKERRLPSLQTLKAVAHALSERSSYRLLRSAVFDSEMPEIDQVALDLDAQLRGGEWSPARKAAARSMVRVMLGVA